MENKWNSFFEILITSIFHMIMGPNANLQHQDYHYHIQLIVVETVKGVQFWYCTKRKTLNFCSIFQYLRLIWCYIGWENAQATKLFEGIHPNIRIIKGNFVCIRRAYKLSCNFILLETMGFLCIFCLFCVGKYKKRTMFFEMTFLQMTNSFISDVSMSSKIAKYNF